MSGITKSPKQLGIEQLLRDAAELLKRANRYVSVHPSIGGQKLGEEITTFRAQLLNNPPVDFNLEEEAHG